MHACKVDAALAGDMGRLRASFRVRLDVNIEDLGIEFDTIPNQTSFGNGSQCQSDCLDVDELLDRNQRANKYQIVFGWACRQIQN